jgi:hypothetical protein
MSAENAGPSFERDIRPLFRPEDIDATLFAFDLGSCEDVRPNAEAIHRELADGSMPCDARWPDDPVERLRALIDSESPP